MVRFKFKVVIDSYRCCIKQQEIPSKVNANTFEGEHEENRTNDDVLWIWIDYSSCPIFPDGLGETFKNVKMLWIKNSNLNEISKENFKQFPNLESLNLNHNQIEKLPEDLFEFNKKLKLIDLSSNKIQSIESGLLDELQDLEIFSIGGNQLEFVPGDFFKFNKKIKRIGFSCNEIKFIGPELLDGLEKLEYVKFENNPCIKIEGLSYCPSPLPLNEIKQKIKSLQVPIELKEIVEKSKLKSEEREILRKKNIHKDLMKFLEIEEFKDFNVKIAATKFKVHKFLLIARSETFAELIKNNPDADELILEDITIEIFEVILNFLYTDEAPKDSKNARKIFSAASKLKIKKLKEIYGEILAEEVEKVGDLRELREIYNFGARSEYEKLKLKAFEEIKKNITGANLKDELLGQPEKLNKIIETKLAFDELLK